MSISEMSLREFIHLVYLPKEQLWTHLVKLTPMKIMAFRRAMQISLSRYSRKMSTMDDVQLTAIGQIQYIENYCRRRYFKDMGAEIRKKYTTYSEAQIKETTRDKWEKFVKKMSY